MKPRLPKNAFVYLLIMAASIALFYSFLAPSESVREISLNKVAEYIKQGKVETLTLSNDGIISLTLRSDGDRYRYTSRKEPNIGFGETMATFGVTPEHMETIDQLMGPKPTFMETWGVLLANFVPFILIGVFLLFMLRQAQSGNNQAMSFGKSRARMVTGDRPSTTFEDVAGAEEAKQELQEVVEFLKEPDKFTTLGARIPKGVLLMGAPGTGKTLMARAVAGEAGVPFFSISGSEFVEMFVGVGASRVRDLFDQAKRNSPCIVFVDEIDAVGRQRGAGLGGSHDEREQTLNQILVEMDGFDTDTKVIIIAATNRPDILDPALLRPGRFDRRVVLDKPDWRGREAILEVHVRGKPLAPDVDLSTLAKQTPGFTGADIENLVNEAAILAARRNKRAIGGAELQEAVERVVAGPERRSRIMTDEEKKLVAYHEAGHALVGCLLEHTDPIHKVSIIARGMAKGLTWSLPEDDREMETKSKLEDEIAMALGGRAAEALVFDDISSGASSDLRKVTEIARAMIKQWAMSDSLGQRTFGQQGELVFLGREIGEQRDYSEEMAAAIDREIKALVDRAYNRAKEIIQNHRDKLNEVAEALLEKETINGDELRAIVGESAKREPALSGV